MLRKPVQSTFLLLIIIGTLNSVSANAQERIRAGQTINGVLEASDYAPNEWQIEDHYLYEGQEGEKIKITLTKKSDNFGGNYMVGRIQLSPRKFSDINLRPQQDGTITLPHGGVWGIAVTAHKTGHGPYTLLIEQVSLPTTPSKQFPEIRAGEIRAGSWNEKSQKIGSFWHELWAYQGRKGERIRITATNSSMSLGRLRLSTLGDVPPPKPLPYIPTRDSSYNPSSAWDAVLDEDATYLIVLRSTYLQEYKVGIESFGVFDAAAQLPISNGVWKQLGTNEESTVFIDDAQTKFVAGEHSYKLYRARVRFDLKKAGSLGSGAKYDRMVVAIEVACGQRQLSTLSALAYSGDKLLSGGWALDAWQGFSQERFGGVVINHVCQQK